MSLYTPALVAELRDCAPMDLQKAKSFADKHGMSYRSVIAKCKTEQIEYVKLEPAAKKPKGVTKSDLAHDIAVSMGMSADDLTGLDKAPFAVLEKILAAFPSVSDES